MTYWLSPTQPYEHQLRFAAWRRGEIDGEIHPRALLQAHMGKGKTLMGANEILNLVAHNPYAQTLVLAPHANIATVWGEQLPRHAPGLKFVLLNGPRKKRHELLESEPNHHACVWVHSHEDLPVFGKALAQYAWDFIIIDECSNFRTASSARTGYLIGRKNPKTGEWSAKLDAPYKLAMSGLPVVKNASDLYPILRWLRAYEGTKAQFSEQFLILDGYGAELVVKDVAGLNRLLETCRFEIDRSAGGSIPRSWRYDRLPMPKWQRDDYRRIQRELRTRHTDADGVLREREIVTNLTELVRLHQLTAGFEQVDEDHLTWHDDNPKTRHLIDTVMPELDGERVIVWCTFKTEASKVQAQLIKAGYDAVGFHGGQSDEENDAGYADWKMSTPQVFVTTLAKGAKGLNLPEASATYYHSRNFNTEAIVQSLERNARLDTKHAGLKVIVAELEDSVDQHISRVVGDDLNVAASLSTLQVREILGY